MLKSLENRLNPALGAKFGVAASIVGSAVVFGLVHAVAVELLGLVSLGIVLAVLANRNRRLGMGIFIHSAFNATTVVLLARGH